MHYFTFIRTPFTERDPAEEMCKKDGGQIGRQEERCRGWHKLRATYFTFPCQCLVRFWNKREPFKWVAHSRAKQWRPNVPLHWSMVCQKKQSPLCFGAALQCVCPLWWLMPTEDMYVRDTVETGPTKSHDWLFPLPVGGRDKHIPHRAWWDRLCAENGIVTKKKKHIFSDKPSLFLLPTSSFLTVTNTLNMIDSIVFNHTSLFLVLLQTLRRKSKKISFVIYQNSAGKKFGRG